MDAWTDRGTGWRGQTTRGETARLAHSDCMSQQTSVMYAWLVDCAKDWAPCAERGDLTWLKVGMRQVFVSLGKPVAFAQTGWEGRCEQVQSDSYGRGWLQTMPLTRHADFAGAGRAAKENLCSLR